MGPGSGGLPVSNQKAALFPAAFEPNRGQAGGGREFDYLARGRGQTLFLRGGEAVLSLTSRSGNSAAGGADSGLQVEGTLRMRVAESGSPRAAEPSGALPGRVSYFRGSTPAEWRTGIPTFGRVAYAAVRPGLDLVYYARAQSLEYDLVLRPGTDPAVARLEFQGLDGVALKADGSLELRVGTRSVTHHRPIAYQEVAGRRQRVNATFRLASAAGASAAVVGFEVGAYDRALPLVIDPVVTFSTYLGGANYDEGTGIGVDSQGNTYVAGVTSSIDFPGAGLPPPGSGVSEAFVAKFSPDGQTLLYAAYLGGSDSDVTRGLAVHADGGVTIAGSTFSPDFPVVNAAQPLPGGGLDGFVSRVNASGTGLVYSTYLGGAADDIATAVATDGQGSAVVAGSTASANFPTLNALQPARAGTLPRSDAFVTKLRADGVAVFSTYFGGSGIDAANSIAANTSGRIWITGHTESTDFPTANAMQAVRLGAEGDAFVASLSATGAALLYSTYLGGSGGESGNAITVDSLGRAYVAGVTESVNFPGPTESPSHHHGRSSNEIGVLHTGFNGGEGDAFVVRLASSGKLLEYSHLVGGVGFDTALAIGVDSLGRAHVAGFTDSDGIQQLHALQGSYGGGQRDVFLIGVNSRGTAHTYISFLGGAGADRGRAIAVMPSGEARVTGETASNDFLRVNAWQDHLGGASQFGGDAFVTVLTGPTRPPAPTGLTATLRSRRAIRIAWVDQSDDETGFVIERSDAATAAATVATAGPNETFADDTTAETERTYTYRVYAVNGAGLSEPSDSTEALIAPDARLVVSPKRLQFGGVRLGASRQRAVRLRNTGRGELRAWLDGPGAPFALVGPRSISIGPRSSATVTVEMAPTGQTGHYVGEMRIRSSDYRHPTVKVKLLGRVLPVPSPGVGGVGR